MKILKIISDHSQISLILSILLMIIVSPYYWNAPFAEYFNFLFLALILFSSILTLKNSRGELRKLGKAGYIIIIISLTVAISQNADLELINRILFILYLILVAVNLLIEIAKSKAVDTRLIVSAVAVYVLFGFCGAVLAAVIMFFEPQAFSLTAGYASQFHQFLYFSYITITTTGYGDVLPISPVARTLSIFLALFGNLYLTVIIGILIGKYLSGNKP